MNWHLSPSFYFACTHNLVAKAVILPFCGPAIRASIGPRRAFYSLPLVPICGIEFCLLFQYVRGTTRRNGGGVRENPTGLRNAAPGMRDQSKGPGSSCNKLTL